MLQHAKQENETRWDSLSICVVEDDEKLAELLCNQLIRFGYQPTRITDFRKVDEAVLNAGASLALLDINLPYYDGFYWCRRIRSRSNIPIVFISARSGEMDQVLALESGGDDYITKPFHPEVFVAKIRALLRRTYGEYADDAAANRMNISPTSLNKSGFDESEQTPVTQTEHSPGISDTIQFGVLLLDTRRATIRVEEQSVSLTVTELELLRQLIEAQGRIVSRESLLESLWDDTQFVDDNTLTVNVARVRRKLSDLGLSDVIVTVRGLGYRLDVDGLTQNNVSEKDPFV